MSCKKDPQKHLCILRISRYCIALRTTVPELLLRTRSLILTQLSIFKHYGNQELDGRYRSGTNCRFLCLSAGNPHRDGRCAGAWQGRVGQGNVGGGVDRCLYCAVIHLCSRSRRMSGRVWIRLRYGSSWSGTDDAWDSTAGIGCGIHGSAEYQWSGV